MKIRTLLLVFISLCTHSFAKNNTFGVYELSCEQRSNPVGIEFQMPRFSWKISSQERGFVQSAYHILVADSPQELASDRANVWDSKRNNSSESVLIPFDGTKLRPSTKYYWKVKVWDSSKKSSAWSETSTFVTGLFNQSDWGDSRWIALEADSKDKELVPGVHAPLVWREIGERKVGMYKLPQFRKEVPLKKNVKEAYAHISGLGHFELLINGVKVGDNFLDPGWTKYSKTALYVSFDVTNMLKQHNVVGVMLGNGFYNIPRERYFKQLISYGAPKFIMCLDLVYDDGSRARVVSDNSWKTTQSPLLYSSIYGGEDYDATQELQGWGGTGYNASSWNDAIEVTCPVELKPQLSAPLKIRQRLETVRKYKNSKGNLIFDLGQNFSGIIELEIKGARGEAVLMRPGELLNRDSTVNQSASGAPYLWKYTLKGDDAEKWQPRFTYYGFRYVELECGNIPVENIRITGLHTTNSASEVGHFSCSLPMFNKVYELIDWSVRSNLASILTDCPHREKLGWMEVAHLMQYSMQYRYDLSGLYAKLMGDMSDSQTPEGIIPSIAPEYVRFGDGFENSPEWGSAFVIIPWYVYKWYGDKQLLEEYYPSMKRYVDYLSKRANNGIVAYGLGDWFDLGPKNPGRSQLTSNGVTATAMYYYNTTIMAQVAKMCGKESDHNEFTKLAAEIKKAFNDKFYDSAKQIYDRNSQTSNAVAIHFDLVANENKSAVYKNLIKDIESRNYALTSGDIGYRYLLRVLESNGDSEIIRKMNTKYDVPGYGWQLAHGATALTESWQAYGFVSNNHCMLGHLMEWFFSGLGGIGQMPESAGFKTLKIEPQMVRGIDRVSSSYVSPYGDVVCNIQIDGENYKIDLLVPANSDAIVYLPVLSQSVVTEGGIAVEDSRGCQVQGVENDKLLVRVRSGRYLFTVKNR